MQPVVEQNANNEPNKIRNGTVAEVARAMIRYASTPTIERSFLSPKNGIPFADKVRLMESYPFLRTFSNLKDLDEAADMIRKVLLMGEKSLQIKANQWMKDNDKALDTHQILRKEIGLAEIIEDVFGSNLPLDDPDTGDILRKCRAENMSDSVKPGPLGLLRKKRYANYESDTESAVGYLRKMQDSYSEFLQVVRNDFNNLERTEFHKKYSMKSL